jgi:hypothetical protein
MKARLVLLLLGVLACSVLNREGPDVTCADLGDGARNACAEGIIATCSAGEVRWHVCDDKKACEQTWQIDGQFRCADSESVPGAGGGGGSGAIGGSGASGGTGGKASAVAVCGTCPSGYSMAANACNKECGDCGCFQSLCAQQGLAVQLAQDACPSGQHSVLAVPNCLASCANCGQRLLCVPD